MSSDRLQEALNLARHVTMPEYVVQILIVMRKMEEALDAAVDHVIDLPPSLFLEWADQMYKEGDEKSSFFLARMGIHQKMPGER